MAAHPNQKLKLLYLLQLLQEGTDAEHGLAMTEIITALEERGCTAERKSVYRDIDVLRQAGIEVETLRTNPVQYAIKKRAFSLNELMLITDAVQSSRFLTESKAAALTASIKQLASDRQAKLLNRQIHVEGRIKSINESVYHNINTIHEAMRDRQKVSFLYFKYGVDAKPRAQRDGKPYVLTPVQLVYTDGLYYLVVFDARHDDFATYRIDRMQLLQVSPEKADRNDRIANFSFEAADLAQFGMWMGEKTAVTLKVSAECMGAVVDRFGADIDVSPKDKSAEVYVTVNKSSQFYAWVASLEGGVRIVAPKKVRKEYRQWLKARFEEA